MVIIIQYTMSRAVGGQDMAEKQVRSRQRVIDHGEVFTAEREVNAMLDLVKNETERIESRFLEPACGDGNFLAEILRRKLAVVRKKYGGVRKHHDFEMWSVIAVMNIYGVELLPDNAAACRERLFKIWNEAYTANCKADAQDVCRDAVRYILDRNILCGDALSMKQENGEPIIFAEWAFVSGTKVKRRDFRLDGLLNDSTDQLSISDNGLVYDEKSDAFIPKPLEEYPPKDYWRVQNV